MAAGPGIRVSTSVKLASLRPPACSVPAALRLGRLAYTASRFAGPGDSKGGLRGPGRNASSGTA
jgi:hypothetical protein